MRRPRMSPEQCRCIVGQALSGASFSSLAKEYDANVDSIRDIVRGETYSTITGRTGKMTPEERFWRKVDKTGDCWLWTGVPNNHGYGTMMVNGKLEYVHRFSFTLAYGPIPNGLWVCHHCDVPLCVNPEHLFAGTAKDNAVDMARKERAFGTKLSADDVKHIRASSLSRRNLAKKFGVTRQCVDQVLLGITWGWLAN